MLQAPYGAPLKGDNMTVFVTDKHKKPLMPCSEKRAHVLLDKGKAVIHKMEPFTIRLKNISVKNVTLQPLRLKLDPGSKTTGLAILEEDSNTAVWFGEIHHKTWIKTNLADRSMYRRRRRTKNLRYRPPRFDNRVKGKGWLPPSLISRIDQTVNTIKKLQKLTPLISVSIEHVKFDTQLMENAEIKGTEYQQGKLFGWEQRAYLQEKFNHKCAYCGKGEWELKGMPFNIDHVVPKSKGGTNRIDNLVWSCKRCNEQKSNMSLHEFGKLRNKDFSAVKSKAKSSLKDAAVMNSIRWRLISEIEKTGLKIELGSGGRTKYQRKNHGLPKTHYYDALCVGKSTPLDINIQCRYVTKLHAKGRGTRKIVQLDKYGFPRQYRKREKMIHGFMTGDRVRATTGKHTGVSGRLVARVKGPYININGKRFGTSYNGLLLIQRNDGWDYEKDLALTGKPSTIAQED